MTSTTAVTHEAFMVLVKGKYQTHVPLSEAKRRLLSPQEAWKHRQVNK
jgi:hypothetical protein